MPAMLSVVIAVILNRELVVRPATKADIEGAVSNATMPQFIYSSHIDCIS
jgi:hypothetical protein